ncbi:hypothetical protein C0J56_15260 [Pseudomonas fluorescens]|jgi:hypothetical protein|nr:hypothetical protein C0J56_15260 [Pseudomonas fluorescens]MDP9782462.1 hypothetical protein [Pseudomonas fluorescens]
MADQAGDILVEPYRDVKIWRKQYDPYGGPTEYYYIYERGRGRSPMYTDLEALKRALGLEIDAYLASTKK